MCVYGHVCVCECVQESLRMYAMYFAMYGGREGENEM